MSPEQKSSTITVDQVEAAEKRWKALRDAGDPAAVEAEKQYQELARAQTVELQAAAYQRQISRMTS